MMQSFYFYDKMISFKHHELEKTSREAWIYFEPMGKKQSHPKKSVPNAPKKRDKKAEILAHN